MSKCILCNKKIKFPRKCLTLNETICSSCCGSKKGLEIKCTDECKYFIDSYIRENKKHINKLVKESFNGEENDIYQDDRMLELVAPFEQFMFRKYYNDINGTDELIFDNYMKILYSLEEKGNIYTFNEVETEVFNEFSRIAKKAKMPIESQKLIVLRMMKSIDSMTGGRYGNRMYLELLRNNFTGTGIVSDVMGKM
ncbi:MAG TPA: hypothetical protein VIK72_10020 [Clostridiaceae bacterium]